MDFEVTGDRRADREETWKFESETWRLRVLGREIYRDAHYEFPEKLTFLIAVLPKKIEMTESGIDGWGCPRGSNSASFEIYIEPKAFKENGAVAIRNQVVIALPWVSKLTYKLMIERGTESLHPDFDHRMSKLIELYSRDDVLRVNGGFDYGKYRSVEAPEDKDYISSGYRYGGRQKWLEEHGLM